jgi:hypothetical protein
MATGENTLSAVVLELGKILQPLSTALQSPASFSQFMQQLGWSATDIPAPLQDIGTAVNALTALLNDLVNGNLSVQDITDVKTAITSVSRAVKAIEAAPDAVFPPELLADNFKTVFPEQVVEYLVGDYLYSYQRSIAFFLQALGVFKASYVPPTGNRLPYMHFSFDFDTLPKAFQTPSVILQNAFGWNTPTFDFAGFVKTLDNLLAIVGLNVQSSYLQTSVTNKVKGIETAEVAILNPHEKSLDIVFFDTGTNAVNLQAGINFIPIPQSGASMPGFAILPYFTGSGGVDIPLATNLTANVTSTMDFEGGIGVLVRPDGVKLLTGFNQPGNPSEASAALTFKAAYTPGTTTNPAPILGSSDGTRLDFTGMAITAGVSVATDSSLEVLTEFQLNNLRLVLSLGDSDGFIRKLVPTNPIVATADLTIGFSNKKGIYFSGSGALEISIPTHIDIGPIEIQNATISIKPGGGTFPLTVGLSVKASLGPLIIVVNNIGLSASLTFPPQQQFVDFTLGFKPPDGAGISVNAGAITGGGFLSFDSDKGQYVGAVELAFQDLFSLKAVGVVQTKMPDGSDGFSLLVIVTADFTPIQLGFGFTLNGVGGLLGLNRTVNADNIKQGLKTNSLQDILFPKDILNNINRIVSDIGQVFPVAQDHFIVGPMGEIGWGDPSIITLQIGILIDMPNPSIILPGVLLAILPTADEPLLKIQVNFVGIIDFDNKLVSFDATLYDSKILLYTLTGDMAFRLSWGNDRYFILSVGGFHPAFKDAPPDLANMTRLTVSLLTGSNPKLTLQCYFAITSNTVQFGAKAELYAAAGGFNVNGFIGYDCLFQFSPFHFDADFQASLALRRGTDVIMSINLSGELSGTSPWEVKGQASISILFFSISVSFDETWGDPASAQTPEKVDLLSLLTAALNDDSNWKATPPPTSSQYVSTRQLPANTGPIVHPFGVLTFSQRILPLMVTITHFGTQIPQDADYFTIGPTDPAVHSDPATDSFAAANFFDMTDSEKLSAPSYETMLSGFALSDSAELLSPVAVSTDVDYRFSYLRVSQAVVKPTGKYPFPKGFFQANLTSSAPSRSTLSFAANRISVNAPTAVEVADEQYTVVSVDTMQPIDPSLTAGSYAEALGKANLWVASRPSLKGQIQVVSSYEAGAI